MDDQNHPDDFVLIHIGLTFAAKPNPTVEDVPPIDCVAEYDFTLPAEEETAERLEEMARAIRERRIFGWMQQECAHLCVGSGQWIEKTTSDLMAAQKPAQRTADDSANDN